MICAPSANQQRSRRRASAARHPIPKQALYQGIGGDASGAAHLVQPPIFAFPQGCTYGVHILPVPPFLALSFHDFTPFPVGMYWRVYAATTAFAPAFHRNSITMYWRLTRFL